MAYPTACKNDVKIDQPDEDDDPVLLGKMGIHRESCTNGAGVAFGNTPLQSKHLVKDYTLDAQTYGTQTRTAWARLYESQQFSDVTLLVGEEEIPSHRVVLATHSRVLSGQLEKQASDEEKYPRIRINIPGCSDSVSIFKEVLRYFYCGTCRLTPDSATGLLHICNYYEVGPLKEACTKFISELPSNIAVGVSSQTLKECEAENLPAVSSLADSDGPESLSIHDSEPQQGQRGPCSHHDPRTLGGSIAGPTLADLPVDILVMIFTDAPLAQLAGVATLCKNLRGAYQERLKERHACITERIKAPSSLGVPWSPYWQEAVAAGLSEEQTAVPRDLILNPPIPERLQCTPHLNSQIPELPRSKWRKNGVCAYQGFCLRGKPDGPGDWTEDMEPPSPGRITYYCEWRQGEPRGRPSLYGSCK